MKNVLNKSFRVAIGFILIVLGLFSGIFSTYATIIPISLSFKGITKTIMVGIFIIVQVSVFFLAMTKNYIARETPQHYILINRIANFLMMVSIISTITFFEINKTNVLEHQKSIKNIYKVVPVLDILPFYDWIINITVNVIFIWSVCIILDVLAIKMPLIGFDIMMGIQEKRKIDTLTSKLIAIATHKPIAWIDRKYNSLGLENCSEESEDENIFVFESKPEKKNLIADPQTNLLESAEAKEESKEELFKKKVLNFGNLKKVFDYIQENKTGNVSPGMGKISQNTEISSGEVDRIRKELIRYGYLQPDKMQTLILKDSLNLEDFEDSNDD